MVQIEWRWPSGKRAHKRVWRRESLAFMLALAAKGATRIRTVA